MTFEKIKQLKNNKLIKRIMYVLLAFTIFLYLKLFFSTGVYYDDLFLKKVNLSNETQYIGKSRQGDIQITVKGQANVKKESTSEVIFNLPNNIYEHYTVNFSDEEEYFLGNVEIKNEKVNVIFKGKYQQGSMFLYDMNNEAIIEGLTFSVSNGKNVVIYDNNYRIPFISIVHFALHENDRIRGNEGMLLAAAILIFFTFIDIKYPLFFFELRHSFEVEDPKPTEFYISMQKLSWGINSTIVLVLLIMAI